ncbi:unnamed protein product [Vicia faba]|uniref:Uncharacterized protein n=1 Tax=Vicia faba TaxID=3906 RepID=A0AAV0YM57_VICFA|nr:unnamed protein product [Vicia faba]
MYQTHSTFVKKRQFFLGCFRNSEAHIFTGGITIEGGSLPKGSPPSPNFSSQLTPAALLPLSRNSVFPPPSECSAISQLRTSLHLQSTPQLPPSAINHRRTIPQSLNFAHLSVYNQLHNSLRLQSTTAGLFCNLSVYSSLCLQLPCGCSLPLSRPASSQPVHSVLVNLNSSSSYTSSIFKRHTYKYSVAARNTHFVNKT